MAFLKSSVRPGALLAATSLISCEGRQGIGGGGDDFAAARERMVVTQLSAPGRDITNERVLAAMRKVPRHEFVPEDQRRHAYEDSPLPIGHGQTISQPYIVAFMSAALDPRPGQRVLEVGTGSGYQAAVLAEMGVKVCSIEIVRPLGERAAQVLARLGYEGVRVRVGDGYLGWPEEAPFDAVIVTCAPEHVPRPLVDQLRDGGRMIIPVGGRSVQELQLLEKTGSVLRLAGVMPVRFVPMTGRAEQDAAAKPE